MSNIKFLAAYVDNKQKKQFNKLLTFKIYNEIGLHRMLDLILKSNDVVRCFYFDKKKYSVSEALDELYRHKHTNREKLAFYQYFIKHIKDGSNIQKEIYEILESI